MMEDVKPETQDSTPAKPEAKAEATPIERAESAVQRMQEAEKRLDEKIAKLTELETNRILGSTAGNHIERITPEQAKQNKAQSIADDIAKAFKQ